jgi:NAD(P) transhydrogenase
VTPASSWSRPLGLTEEAARQRGVDHQVGVAWFKDNSHAAIAGATDGVLELVVDRRERRLLGVHIMGEGATELVHQGQAVLHIGGTVEYFINAIFDVPTVSDTYKHAAYDCLQRLACGQ